MPIVRAYNEGAMLSPALGREDATHEATHGKQIKIYRGPVACASFFRFASSRMKSGDTLSRWITSLSPLESFGRTMTMTSDETARFIISVSAASSVLFRLCDGIA